MDTIKHLSSEEMRYLKFLPPHALNCNEILVKNFGNEPSQEAVQLHRDLCNFHDSVMRIVRLREEVEMNGSKEKVCAKCECLKKSDAAIARMTCELKYRADESLRVLKQVKQEQLENKKRFIDESQDVVNTAAIDDHINYLMGYFEKISMIAEQIYKFNYLLIPDTVE
ncbi:hypothetical protein PV325_010783 [Microctonus aethiopoides]|nr:hypothetical protein PV325_010783 [Microctonus aethiopoides]KAK0074398.1 hypothetical protein PV326_012488 [Microctonus aethiopoides]